MDAIPYDSPQALSSLLAERGLSMKKRFGQNFMVSPHARSLIVGLAGDISGQRVWEIGPGIGALTNDLINRGCHLTAFEIDYGFIRILKEQFETNQMFTLVEGDALKTWGDQWVAGEPSAIIGNLPYSVGSALIADLMEANRVAERQVYTVQKEVGCRMAARPGDKDYSSFSILCQARCKVTVEASLPPSAFFPRPEVVSAVVLLERRELPLIAGDPRIFNILVRSSFASRRKTLENNIKASPLALTSGIESVIRAAEAAGIDIRARGETLAPESYALWAAKIADQDLKS